jgi:hypothetical protein
MSIPKTKSRYLIFALCLVFLLTSVFARVSVVHATSLDNINGSQAEQSTNQQTDDGSALSNYMRNYTPITHDNMNKASEYANPVVSALGTLAGIVMLIVIAAIGVVTALDLCYIYVPITRNALGGGAVGGATPQAGGMGMMGGRYGGMRGGMGMSGGAQPAGHRWVSDEAIQAVAMASAGTQQPMSGGMGMGMQQQQAQPKGKSVALAYLKSRIFALILFGVCSVVLFSSVLTNCGINVGLLILKIIDKVGSSATQVSI